ncbi:hypothetical protein BGZ76_002584 [Entomortierella beljakovae]|nr:hypothetical protein BGZ76_002584 [Entomortierella beljakovae]
MEGFAKTFVDKGFVPIGVYLWWDDQANKKNQRFKPMWDRATIGTYRDYFETEDTGIALLTGEPSDLIVIDCDVLKENDRSNGVGDGIAAFQTLVCEYGLPDNTPEQCTPSGGVHYFFSLSKSMENGLTLIKNSTKIKINDTPMSIDTRADGGCIFVAPSRVGKKKYKFVKRLAAREELQAMPDWCIELLNNSGPSSKKNSRIDSSLSNQMDHLSLCADSSLLHEHRASIFIKNVRKFIEVMLGTTINKIWIRTMGFDFNTIPIVKCVLCGGLHESNHYRARPILDDCFSLDNWSGSYSRTHIFNWEDQECLRWFLLGPTTDKAYSMMLNTSLRGRGYLLQRVGDLRVRNDIADTRSEILATLLCHVHPEPGASKAQIKLITQQRRQLAKGCEILDKSSHLDVILKYYKTLYVNEELEAKLDVNPDIIVVKNGVIDPRTGECRGGLPSDYMSRQLDVNYNGLDTTTPIIDDFIGDLFNKDQDAIECLERLLGFGITARTDSQIWAMFTGEGSNGKSLLAQETEPTEQLNTEILKMITGGGEISMRAAYSRDYEEFEPQVLPILLCNQRPIVDVEDHAMMRRIVVVPFHNIYTTPDDPKRPYDPENPYHRLRDPDIGEKLLLKEAREQLLVWLMRGAVSWYKNKDLRKQPAVMLRAFENYSDENDKLKIFIELFCETGPSKDYYVNTAEFREQFIKAMGLAPIKQCKLADAMKIKGFKQGTPKKNGRTQRVYEGLRLSVGCSL